MGLYDVATNSEDDVWICNNNGEAIGTNYYAMIRLNAGDVVQATPGAGSWNNCRFFESSSNPNRQFEPGSTGYFGFRFTGSDGGTKYGWAKANWNHTNPGLELNITKWAYDDSGAAIRVGDTGAVSADLPAELTMLNLLGLGAIGLAAFRRRRDKFLTENDKAEK
ncbi:hypothetical protein QUF74_03225 [Candidatus Halobeggiatoa sp. HSG11]|nr:hypothetical protein [Candidatus Halobeggiatoa sp. HSG11]